MNWETISYDMHTISYITQTKPHPNRWDEWSINRPYAGVKTIWYDTRRVGSPTTHLGCRKNSIYLLYLFSLFGYIETIQLGDIGFVNKVNKSCVPAQ